MGKFNLLINNQNFDEAIKYVDALSMDYRKGVSKAASFIGESLCQLLVDVVSETAKKALFP